MIYVTQLIYLKPGKEEQFEQFEAVALPLIPLYNGQLLLRLRPEKSSFIEGSAELPYEIHMVSFKSEEDLGRYLKDETRTKVLHLKEEAIRISYNYKGTLM